jgi:hypothetical protein
MAKASSKSSKSSKSKTKRKASPLARKAMKLRSASCTLPLSEAWAQARAKPPRRRARANKGYDTDFSRELSMFDYHHPAYEQTTGQFSASEAFTHGLQPANRRNPRRSARRNGKGYDTDFSREISMFDYHAPQFEQTVGPFGVSEAFTHGLQPANRRNPRRNPRALPVNEMDGLELSMLAVNDADLYRRRAQPIITNLAKKMSKGTFDPELAIKAFQYMADDAAVKYRREFKTAPSVATRKFAAQMLVGQFLEEIEFEANELKAKAKAKAKPARRKAVEGTVGGGLTFVAGPKGRAHLKAKANSRRRKASR